MSDISANGADAFPAPADNPLPAAGTPVVDAAVVDPSTTDPSAGGAGGPESDVTDSIVREAPDTSEIEDEGDVAADYIEELLDICDLDGDIDIDVKNDRSYISVHASDNSELRVLSSPDTVSALQELTRLAVQSRTGEFSRLILDIAGSRNARQSELAKLVDHAIVRLTEGAAQAELPPMSSYERKLVHDVVAERGYVSHSEGEGRERHTVITAA